MRLVEAIYHGASTVVRSFLFTVVLDVISEEVRCGLPSELLFADNLAVVTDTEEDMAWMADWDGEQGTKSQYRENGSDGQQQEWKQK